MAADGAFGQGADSLPVGFCGEVFEGADANVAGFTAWAGSRN
jgi:hypothetical protein